MEKASILPQMTLCYLNVDNRLCKALIGLWAAVISQGALKARKLDFYSALQKHPKPFQRCFSVLSRYKHKLQCTLLGFDIPTQSSAELWSGRKMLQFSNFLYFTNKTQKNVASIFNSCHIYLVSGLWLDSVAVQPSLGFSAASNRFSSETILDLPPSIFTSIHLHLHSGPTAWCCHQNKVLWFCSLWYLVLWYCDLQFHCSVIHCGLNVNQRTPYCPLGANWEQDVLWRFLKKKIFPIRTLIVDL